MENNTDIRLIYEWNEKRAKLDFAIKEIEHQLASAKKRLKGLQQDFIVYVVFIVVPLVLYMTLDWMIQLFSPDARSQHAILYLFLTGLSLIILCIYVIFLPFNIYHLIRTIILLKQNKESSSHEFAPPPLAGSTPHNSLPNQEEPTYRSEYNKLIFVLTRYYLNQDIMDDLLKKINSVPCTITLLELKIELSNLPFYEDIRPANSYPKAAEKQARNIGTVIAFILAFFILFRILIYVW